MYIQSKFIVYVTLYIYMLHYSILFNKRNIDILTFVLIFKKKLIENIIFGKWIDCVFIIENIYI